MDKRIITIRLGSIEDELTLVNPKVTKYSETPLVYYEKDTYKANKVRRDILNWLELTADWSMTLDVPTWAADELNSPKTGLKSFRDTLNGTIYNNKFFQKNRLGQTKFLNVLQGDDWETAQTWYDAIKDFEF